MFTRAASKARREKMKFLSIKKQFSFTRVALSTLDSEKTNFLSIRVAMHLGMNSSEFASRYLKPAEGAGDGPLIMRERPCPFLKDNRCTVHEYRPANCRDYPYLDKPDFTSRTLRMIDRVSECPIVFEVWEELKRATGFGHRSRY
jgi:Fe-S-cluster containining protein